MSMYGFESDSSNYNGPSFGLNQGKAKLIDFKWIPNGGKGGAAQEALEIKFRVGDAETGRDFSCRKFPITKAFYKDAEGKNCETSDPNHDAFKAEAKKFNAWITHILKSFATEEVIKQAFSVPIKDFKEFCTIAASILPKDFQNVSLDIFLQFEYKLKDTAEMTYLQVPDNMLSGYFLCPATKESWQKVSDANGLKYVSGESVHNFARTSKFMEGNNAKQQKKSDTPVTNMGTQGEGW